MYEAGRANWQISVDQPSPLMLGLFIRDVAGVPSSLSWLPPASPAVPRASDTAPKAAGLQWDAWWDKAVREERKADDADWPPDLSSWWTPPAFESLDAAPELQEIVAAHFFEAARWSNDRHHEHGATMLSNVGDLFETKLVRDMERAHGWTAQRFRLWITEIPVEGQQFWQLGPDHVLVAADLLRDTAVYRRRLTPVIEALF